MHQVAEVYRVAVSDIERMLRKGSLSFRVRLVIAKQLYVYDTFVVTALGKRGRTA